VSVVMPGFPGPFNNGRATTSAVLSIVGFDEVAAATLFTYVSTPKIVRAEFSRAATSLSVSFDSNTNLGDAGTLRFPCSKLLEDVSARILAAGSLGCLWADEKTLVIQLGSDATVVPGDVLLFRNDLIKSADNISNTLGNGFATVVAPQEVLKPQLLVTSPEMVGPCNDIELNTIAPSVRPLTYFWKCVNDEKVHSFIAGLQTSRSIVVPVQVLTKIDFTYSFEVQVVDFMGFESDVVQFSVSRLALDAPKLTVFGGRSYAVTEDIYVTVSAEFSKCSGSRTPLVYSWAQSSIAADSFVIPPQFLSTSGPVLLIPAGFVFGGEVLTSLPSFIRQTVRADSHRNSRLR
jgi:hypothetical protein